MLTEGQPGNAQSSNVPKGNGWSRVLWIVAVGVLTILAYRNSFRVPLLFDDEVSIRDNPAIRNLGDIRAVLFPPAHVFSSGRPLLNASFAINYALGRTSVAGYHVVNLAVHLLAGLALFGIVRRSFLLPWAPSKWSERATGVAGLAMTIWLWHPVATAAVTYLSQRAEALMALCYLLTLYCFIRAANSTRPIMWSAASVVCCFAGALSKEVIVTAPFVVLLYDRTFVAGSFRQALVMRPWYYLGLFACSIAVVVLMVTSDVGARGVGFDRSMTAAAYLGIEARALFTYSRVAIWPASLVFDYGETPFVEGGHFVATLVAILIVIATVLLAMQRPKWGFLPLVFFIILAPTSSVVPIALQPVAESRMYLPLAAVSVVIAVLVLTSSGRIGMVGAVLGASALGILTSLRNDTYASAQRIWADTAAKVPHSSRAHGNLGLALLSDQRAVGNAISEFKEALRLKPNYPEAEFNLANAFRVEGRAQDAIAHYRKAIALRPSYASAHANLGWVLGQSSLHRTEAIAELRTALAMEPNDADTKYNLANLLVEASATRPEAIALYHDVIAARPTAAEPHNNLAIALAQSGQLAAAASELQRALEIEPNNAEARRNLAIIQRAIGPK